MSRRMGLVFALFLPLTGCSLLLAPSRHQGGAGDAGAVADGGDRDAAQGHDGGSGRDAGSSRDAASGEAGTGEAGTLDAGSACPSLFECAPAMPPPGWNGPVVLLTGPGDGSPPSCPTNAPFMDGPIVYSGLMADPATCTCSCAPPSPVGSCGSATLQNKSSMCSLVSGLTDVATIANGMCGLVGLASTGNWTLRPPAFTPSSGTCTPNHTTTKPPVGWSASYRPCGFDTRSCGASSICVPTRDAGRQLCIYVDGDATCPAAFGTKLVTTKHVDPVTDLQDTRDCSTCSCGAVGGSCTGFVDISADSGNGCLEIGTEVKHVSGCTPAVAISPPNDYYAHVDYAPDAGCPADGGMPQGMVTLTTQQTFCCTS